jgi:nitric oxide reductase subunit B
LSLIALLVGIGALFAVFGRWGDRLGWRGRQAERISFRPPGDVALTPAQRATAWFFLVVALLFVVQTLLGAASEHYRAEVTNFFGFDLAQILPFNLARTWHLQLALFWVAAAFLAAAIFLAPIIAGREPRGQAGLSYALLGALAVVVFGSLAAEFASIHGYVQTGSIIGNQGFEYLDLPRLWQILLTVGMVLWAVILIRGLRHRLHRDHPGNMPWLFLLSGLAIPAVYAIGLLARSTDTFTTADFWRFWVVHLWVEDFLELFTTVMVAYMFVLLGVVQERIALIVIYLDVLLYSVGGVIGTMHHMYFNGKPAEHLALGAFFSAAEVIPLTFLTVEAWSFLQLGARQEAPSPTPVPAPLGGHVPGGRRLLELLRRRGVRIPHQPAHCVILRDRHRTDRQSWARRNDGRVRHARGRARLVLPALSHPAPALAGPVGENLLLVAQHRPGLDVLRYPATTRPAAAIPLGQHRLLRSPPAQVHHRPN